MSELLKFLRGAHAAFGLASKCGRELQLNSDPETPWDRIAGVSSASVSSSAPSGFSNSYVSSQSIGVRSAPSSQNGIAALWDQLKSLDRTLAQRHRKALEPIIDVLRELETLVEPVVNNTLREPPAARWRVTEVADHLADLGQRGIAAILRADLALRSTPYKWPATEPNPDIQNVRVETLGPDERPDMSDRHSPKLTGIPSPIGGSQITESLDARALALFVQDPTLSKVALATELKCNEKSLSPKRCPRLASAIKVYRASNILPHGRKSADGTIEAWDDG